MPASKLTIMFPDTDKLIVSTDPIDLDDEKIPNWAKFEHMPCPGNIEHGPEIDYCSLGIEIEKLIKYFSNVDSIENGSLTILYDEGLEIRIRSDAQTIFYNSLWFILLHSNCSVFKYSQWARSNYMPSKEPDRMFYMLFSIFLIEDYVVAPDRHPDLDVFKKEMAMLCNVLNSFLDRIRENKELKSDSVSNGIVLFSNTILLLDMEFDEFYTELKDKIKKHTVLEKWH